MVTEFAHGKVRSDHKEITSIKQATLHMTMLNEPQQQVQCRLSDVTPSSSARQFDLQ